MQFQRRFNLTATVSTGILRLIEWYIGAPLVGLEEARTAQRWLTSLSTNTTYEFLICRMDCSWEQVLKTSTWHRPATCPEGHPWRKGAFYVFGFEADVRQWSNKYTRAQLDVRTFDRQRFPTAIQSSPRFLAKVAAFYAEPAHQDGNHIVFPVIVSTDGADKFNVALWPFFCSFLNTFYPGENALMCLCSWHPQRFNLYMDLAKRIWGYEFQPIACVDKDGVAFYAVLRIFVATADDPGTTLVGASFITLLFIESII